MNKELNIILNASFATIFIGLLIWGMVFLIRVDESNYRYKIMDVRGRQYKTGSYSISNDCITFQTCKCADGSTDGTSMQICGNFSIAENPHYQP